VRDDRVPIVFAIDVEPDEPEFLPGSCAPWRGFEGCIELTARLRDSLAPAVGGDVALTWFVRMDPQITTGYGAPTWAADAYARQFSELCAQGDEIGLHVHAWRWLDNDGRWSAELTDPAWLEQCMDVSFDAYRRAFGQPCLAHRSGDRFMSNALLDLVRARGITVDLTPEPGLRGLPTRPGRPHTEPIPDMALVPRQPYFPSPTDWRRPSASGVPDADGLLFIPLASADPGPLLGRSRAAARRVRNVGRPLHRPLLPWADDLGPRIWDVIARDVDRGTLTALAFAVRSHVGVESRTAQTLMHSIDALSRHSLATRLEFVTASVARSRVVARPESLAVASRP